MRKIVHEMRTPLYLSSSILSNVLEILPSATATAATTTAATTADSLTNGKIVKELKSVLSETDYLIGLVDDLAFAMEFENGLYYIIYYYIILY